MLRKILLAVLAFMILATPQSGEVKALSTIKGFPSVSPDFKSVTFWTYENNTNYLYISDPDLKNPKFLMSFGNLSSLNVVWSPDSSKMMIETYDDLVTLNKEGGVIDLYSCRYCSVSTWTKSGIVYALPTVSGPYDSQLYIKNGSSPAKKITQGPYKYLNPDWSPNGEMILADRHIGHTHDIAILNKSGTELHIFNGHAAAWSPDSSKVAYYQDSVLYVFDVNQKKHQNIDTGGISPSDPTWSPDGTKIIFSNKSTFKPVWVDLKAGSVYLLQGVPSGHQTFGYRWLSNNKIIASSGPPSKPELSIIILNTDQSTLFSKP